MSPSDGDSDRSSPDPHGSRDGPLPGVTAWGSPHHVLLSGSLAGTEMSLQAEEAEEGGGEAQAF